MVIVDSIQWEPCWASFIAGCVVLRVQCAFKLFCAMFALVVLLDACQCCLTLVERFVSIAKKAPI